MKLNRRNFLKGLGITSLTIPFLHKLPEPPAPEPEPEPISLLEEYNKRIEEMVDLFPITSPSPVWGSYSCSSDLWNWDPGAINLEFSLYDKDLIELAHMYYLIMENGTRWGYDELVGPILASLERERKTRCLPLSGPGGHCEVWGEDWRMRFRRTASGRWVAFSPFGYRLLESPNRSET